MCKLSRKKIALGFLASFLFTACGSDSSSSGIDLEESFNIVLSKAQYEYNSKDSTLIIKKPVCKVGDLGNLVWKEESPDSTDTLKAYLDKKTALLFEEDITEPMSFGFDGEKFPDGLWYKEKSSKFQSGYKLKKGDLYSVLHYDGECYAQDFKANMFEDNESIAKTEEALLKLYQKFLPSDDNDIEEDKVLKNIRAADCDKLTLFDDLISVEIEELKEREGEVTISYENDECTLNFAIRYAINEEDCKEAYDEFKNDKTAEEFDFYNYRMKLDYNSYCIDRLVIDMKEDNSIKKTASTKSDSKEFIKAIAEIILSGMK